MYTIKVQKKSTHILSLYLLYFMYVHIFIQYFLVFTKSIINLFKLIY